MIILLLPSKISAFLTIRLLVHAVHADIIFGRARTADKKKEYRTEILLVAHAVLLEPFIQQGNI